MKRQMRKFFILFVLFILACTLAGCGKNGKDITVRPNDYSLDYWIGETIDIAVLDTSKIYEKSDEHIVYLDSKYSFSSDTNGSPILPKECVIYRFYFIDDAWKVSSIYVTDHNVKVFGLTMSSSESKIRNTLNNLGFEYLDKYSGFDACYKKENTEIRVYSTYISIDIVIQNPTEKKSLKFSEIFAWAGGLKITDILQVNYETGSIGVSPDILPDKHSSQNNEDIEKVLEICKQNLTPIDNPQITGGSYRKYTIVTANNSYGIFVSNGYIVVENSWYRIDNFTFPVISGESAEIKKLKFSEVYSWADELKIADIIQVDYETGYIGVSPDISNEQYSSQNNADIEKVFEICNQDLILVNNPQITGGGYQKYTIVTADKSYEIFISNGYVVFEENWYSVGDFVFPHISTNE